MKSMMEGFGKDSSRLPEFIRTSGEYMDFINTGKREVSEEQFKAEILKRYMTRPMALLTVLKNSKAHIEEKGWAALEDKDGNGKVVVWTDKFDMDLPASIADLLGCSITWPYNEIVATVVKFPGDVGDRHKPAIWPALPEHVELTGYVVDGQPKLDSGDDVMKFKPEEK